MLVSKLTIIARAKLVRPRSKVGLVRSPRLHDRWLLAVPASPAAGDRGQQRHGSAAFRDQDFLPTLHTRKQFGELAFGPMRADLLHCRPRKWHLAEQTSRLRATQCSQQFGPVAYEIVACALPRASSCVLISPR